REDGSHRPEGETRYRKRTRRRRGFRPAPTARPEADPRDEGPAHHEPTSRDAAQEAQPFGDEGQRHTEQGGAEEESVADGHPVVSGRPSSARRLHSNLAHGRRAAANRNEAPGPTIAGNPASAIRVSRRHGVPINTRAGAGKQLAH